MADDTVIFDTDIMIWVQRAEPNAIRWVDDAAERYISAQTYLELMQTAPDRGRQRLVKRFIKDMDIRIIPIDEDISHRAMVYIEEYGLAHGLDAGDVLVAATAVERGMTLASGNDKHFRAIRDLDLKIFRPSRAGRGRG